MCLHASRSARGTSVPVSPPALATSEELHMRLSLQLHEDKEEGGGGSNRDCSKGEMLSRPLPGHQAVAS